jgi:pimeloyl-ACP methyl ester carboxylesterase
LRLLAGIASALLFVLGLVQTARLEPPREKGILPTNPPTPYIHYVSAGEPHRRALVVHGLDASKELMQFVCSAMADAGFEVYAIDLPGHGDSTAGFDGLLARSAVEQAVSYLNPDIGVGHSMGAALLIDLAPDVKFRTLVLISPVPTQVNRLKFDHTLVTTELFDIPAVNTFAPELEGVEMRKFEWGMHSSALVNPAQIREIVSWLGGDPERLRTSARLMWLVFMFSAAVVFTIVLFPSRLPAERKRGSAQPQVIIANSEAFSQKEILLSFVFAGGVSIVVQRFVSVFHWIRFYATDYLVSFLFLTGLGLLIPLALRKRSIPSGSKAVSGSVHFLKATVLAAYVIVFLGLLTGSHLIHMTLADDRWWRFPAIAAASFPLFLFDETAVRESGKGWQAAGIGIATRVLLIAWIATGVLILNRESAFLVLLSALILPFWIALWFFTGIVHRHIQNSVATALFAALVQGWMFAAWFVIT